MTTAALFAGRRGLLLAGLLLAEFAGAFQSVAYSTVLPLASRELNGATLYGATLAVGSLTTILVVSTGTQLLTRLNARRTLFIATAVYVVGVVVAATAPAMALVLLGSVLRGGAGGLLMGFGLTALGTLFEEELRPRVLGLYALVWILPALVGAPLNAVVAVLLGWRWAIAWPAVVVVLARLLVGRHADLVQWGGSKRRGELGNGLVVLLGLVIASLASTVHERWAIVVFAVGLAVAAAASRRGTRGLLDRDPHRTRTATTFLLLCLAYFGGAGLMSLAVIEGLQRGAVAGSIAVGAGLLAWAAAGARPPKADLRVLGLVLLASALAAEAVAQVLPRGFALGTAVAGWAVAGLGMGLAYPRVYAAPLEGSNPDDVAAIATGVEFAELTGTALGTLAGGGLYSLANELGISAGTAIGGAFAMLAALAALTVLGQFGGASRARSASMSRSMSG